MDNELVSGSLSAKEGNEHSVRSPFITYTQQFYEHFPYYLSIGMTYDQYWNGDPMLTKYYRQADEMRNERKNQELWLQGMYIYEALCDVAPIMTAMPKKGAKPHRYSEKPYSITEKQLRKEREEKERLNAEKGLRMMQRFMSHTNKQLNKEVE